LYRTPRAQYAPGDTVTVWVNKVGPYFNPQETYPYYDNSRLPFCRPQALGVDSYRKKRQGGGDAPALEV
jgi:hypothetical protein